jgi:UDP:flavonoid glycosyltransferase YjiC (YdhE family)
VYAIEGVPHDWLFPRVAAVAHHGGMGTTAEGLRAGVPSIIIPRLLDQRFWSKRVHELGVGPRPIPHRHLSSERLAEAIHAATADRSMRQRAASLGRRIRDERGVAVAVEAIQEYASLAR